MTKALQTVSDYKAFFTELDPRIQTVIVDDVRTMPGLGPGTLIIRLGVKWRWYDFWFIRRNKAQAWQAAMADHLSVVVAISSFQVFEEFEAAA